MEIEENRTLSLLERVRQITQREGYFKDALDLNEYYCNIIDSARDAILKDHFENLIDKIQLIVLTKIEEQGNFLNYI